ncbi:hypothetical protein GW915_01540 [bacterium]|nr:hypothetical protein [bacterium]
MEETLVKFQESAARNPNLFSKYPIFSDLEFQSHALTESIPLAQEAAKTLSQLPADSCEGILGRF